MKKISPSEKRTLLIGGAIVLTYLIAFHVIEPIHLHHKKKESQIQSKMLFIKKYMAILQQKEFYQKKDQFNMNLEADLNRRFLESDKPSLSGAALQKILQETARRSNVHIVQSKIEKAKFTEGLLTVPVQFTIRSPLKNLSRFIHQIENHSKFLVIEGLSLRRINKNDPEHLETRMVVNGFIKKLLEKTTKKI